MNNIVNEKGHNFDEVCEGNVFTGVCPQGVSVGRGRVSAQGVCVWGVSAQGGISVQGVLCLRDPPYGNVQAVRIILKCSVVFYYVVLL